MTTATAERSIAAWCDGHQGRGRFVIVGAREAICRGCGHVALGPVTRLFDMSATWKEGRP